MSDFIREHEVVPPIFITPTAIRVRYTRVKTREFLTVRGATLAMRRETRNRKCRMRMYDATGTALARSDLGPVEGSQFQCVVIQFRNYLSFKAV